MVYFSHVTMSEGSWLLPLVPTMGVGLDGHFCHFGGLPFRMAKWLLQEGQASHRGARIGKADVFLQWSADFPVISWPEMSHGTTPS